mgnify:CR=1 FL=1
MKLVLDLKRGSRLYSSDARVGDTPNAVLNMLSAEQEQMFLLLFFVWLYSG